MSGAPFLEIGTDDVAATRRFFETLFGWTAEDMPQGALFQTPTGQIGVHGDDPDGGVVPYFAVDDMGAAVARVRAAGGTVEGDISSEAGFGDFVACRDPRGVRFELHGT